MLKAEKVPLPVSIKDSRGQKGEQRKMSSKFFYFKTLLLTIGIRIAKNQNHTQFQKIVRILNI